MRIPIQQSIPVQIAGLARCPARVLPPPLILSWVSWWYLEFFFAALLWHSCKGRRISACLKHRRRHISRLWGFKEKFKWVKRAEARGLQTKRQNTLKKDPTPPKKPKPQIYYFWGNLIFEATLLESPGAIAKFWTFVHDCTGLCYRSGWIVWTPCWSWSPRAKKT